MDRVLAGAALVIAVALIGDEAYADESAAANFICRGTRAVFEDSDPRQFAWVERRWRVDFASGEVRDAKGRRLEAEITSDLIAFQYPTELWSRRIVRAVQIDRKQGAYLEQAQLGPSMRGRTEGVCLRVEP